MAQKCLLVGRMLLCMSDETEQQIELTARHKGMSILKQYQGTVGLASRIARIGLLA